MMPEWSRCDHHPNPDGTACAHCGMPAERVDPDELADAWRQLLADRPAEGQTSWLD